jgi:hypothetical protein
MNPHAVGFRTSKMKMIKGFRRAVYVMIGMLAGCMRAPDSNDQRHLASSREAAHVINESDAIRLAAAAIQENKLAAAPAQCMSFNVDRSDAEVYNVIVRERHDEQCGGDPETAPRLFTFIIGRQSGKMLTDARDPGRFSPLH